MFPTTIKNYQNGELGQMYQLLFKKSATNKNLIKKNILSFTGFQPQEFNKNVDYAIKSIGDDGLICICGQLEIPALPNTMENARNIIKNLTVPEVIMEEIISPTSRAPEPRDDVSHSSLVTVQSLSSSREDNEIKRRIRQFKDKLSTAEENMIDLEEEQEGFAENSAEFVTLDRKLKFLRRRMDLYRSKILELENEYSSNTFQDHKNQRYVQNSNNSIQNWINSQKSETAVEEPINSKNYECSREIESIKEGVKHLLNKNNQNLQLPDFNGSSSLDWYYFHLKYKVSTDNYKLSNDENMLRLNCHLKGSARDKVDLILKSCKDPQSIIKILETHYGGIDKILKELLEKSHNLNKVISLQDFQTYNCAVQNIASVIRQIDNNILDVQRIIAILMEKLPDHLISQWANYLLTKGLPQKGANFEMFTDWIDSISGIVSEVTFFNAIHSMNYDAIKTKKVESSEESNTTVKPSPNFRKQCKVCKKEGHMLHNCEEFKSLTPQKRFSIAKKFNYCFSCLNKHFGSCKKKKACQINNCARYHHPLLHQEEVPQAQSPDAAYSLSAANYNKVLLKMVAVRIKNGVREKVITAFLDEGATTSLIDSSIVNELGIKGIPESLGYESIGNQLHEETDSQRVRFEISGLTSNFQEIADVHTIRNLKLPKQTINFEKVLETYPELKNFNISNAYATAPLLLLGQRHISLIASRQVLEIRENGPMISKTRIGWALHGPLNTNNSNHIFCFVNRNSLEEKADELIREQFIIEDYGVNDTGVNVKEEDKLCEEITRRSIKKCGNQFEVALPWKNIEEKLPNSYPLAFKRLKFLEKKLLTDNLLNANYKTQINLLLEKGYARRISFSSLKQKKKVWILPHFAVNNPRKPHKPPRVVFDAAAKVDGNSLNDYLYSGPDWLASIIGVLLRFRQHKIAFAGDICEMFNRVLIKDEDTFAQCFLWRDVNINEPIRLYQMKAMLFGIKSSPFLAQFVKNHNAEQHRQEFPEAFVAITRNHYVDDYLDSRNTIEEAKSIIRDVIHVHKQGGFKIRSFICNNAEVLSSIPEELVTSDFSVSVQSKNCQQKVLGMMWNAKDDLFQFSTFFIRFDEDILNFKRIPSKREVLRITMSLFDPLGLLSPITIKARLLMREISNASISWDTQISDEMFASWKKWLNEVYNLKNLEIERCYNNFETSKLIKTELHIFNDASMQAYSSAAYLRFIHEEGIKSSLIYAKARVAPKSLKSGKLTIPKMELMAAQLGTKIASVIQNELTIEISKVYYWTDSSTVMAWLNSKKKLPVFEANRVQNILGLSKLEDWHWLSTKVNVADLSTRDGSFLLTSENPWFRGPDFLAEDESQWERFTGRYDKNINSVEYIMVIEKVISSSFMPDVNRFSTYSRLINTTAWLKRFISNCRCKIQKEELTLKSHLILKEITWAEKQWFKVVQADSFPQDLQFAKDGLRTQRRLIKQPVILDEDLLCINGRLNKCEQLPTRMKRPIILDGAHQFVHLLVTKLHCEANHVSLQTVINNFRKYFWMPKMKLKIKSIIQKCLYCRKRDCKPIHPLMGELPQNRLQFYTKPFTFCGIDYFGPFQVKHGRKLEQRYGVLFTCMTTRAIHVEIANQLDSSSCILAIRRMKSRRGRIQEMWSDNGTNFKGANRELLNAIREIQPEIMEKELVKYSINWKNIPPASPNFGGAWERLIGAFKRSIEAVFVTNRHPTDEILNTTFCEAEYLINSRPLYIISEDPLDSNPITPNDILIPGELLEKPQGDFSQDEISKKSWRVQQFLINCFWKRFIKEYIPTLLLRSKWNDLQTNLKVGDTVYLKDFEFFKGKWPLGIVEKVYPGEDGVVRVADIRTENKTLRRAVNKLSICKF